jgi:SNF family Na+-dependent transporter
MFSCLDGFVSTLCDISPRLHKHKRWLIAAWAFIFFLFELPLVTRGGIYLFTLEEYYGSASITLLSMALFQAAAYVWIWGADKISDCVFEMTGVRLSWWWRFCWKFAGPGYMLVSFL